MAILVVGFSKACNLVLWKTNNPKKDLKQIHPL